MGAAAQRRYTTNTSMGSTQLRFNAEDKPMTFLIPSPLEHSRWRLAVDSAADLPLSGVEPIAKPLVDPTVVTNRGCNPMIEDCARAMGGDDPASAYAAAILWYQGYPEAPHPSGV